MKLRIFDLDGTVIDSSHRYATKPNGDIDLSYWRENSTPENIFKDKLLPCANVLRAAWARGTEHVIICTARVMQKADFDFLQKHGLHSHAILFRPDGVMDSDADLKEQALDNYLDGYGGPVLEDCQAVIYEDNLTVIERLRGRGVLGSYVGDYRK